MGRDQPHPEWHRTKAELRVALLRGPQPAVRVRRRQSAHLRGPLRTGGRCNAPYFAYHHTTRVVPNESCPTGSSSTAGLEFEFAASQNSYPAEYDGGLFFADYTRDCIWAMQKGADGHPAPGLIRTFVAAAANPVNLETGPGGDLFYVDFDGGTIRRITYTSANRPPVASATATPTTGVAPLTVNFSGSGSSDPDSGDTLSYGWDLDGDGAFDDSTAVQPMYTYTSAGSFTATLRVTDTPGQPTPTASRISVGGNTAPTAVINTPAAGTTWRSAMSSTSPGRRPTHRTARCRPRP